MDGTRRIAGRVLITVCVAVSLLATFRPLLAQGRLSRARGAARIPAPKPAPARKAASLKPAPKLASKPTTAAKPDPAPRPSARKSSASAPIRSSKPAERPSSNSGRISSTRPAARRSSGTSLQRSPSSTSSRTVSTLTENQSRLQSIRSSSRGQPATVLPTPTGSSKSSPIPLRVQGPTGPLSSTSRPVSSGGRLSKVHDAVRRPKPALIPPATLEPPQPVPLPRPDHGHHRVHTGYQHSKGFRRSHFSLFPRSSYGRTWFVDDCDLEQWNIYYPTETV